MEYTPTYGASMLLKEQAAENLYQREPMLEYTQKAVLEMYADANPIWLDQVRYPPWYYPPHFILLVFPLAFLPYWWSLVCWNTVTAIPYLAATRNILPGHIAWPFALAMPAVYFNISQGQTGFLTAGLIGLGLTLLRHRPVLAGVFIGLASIKPHFGLLIPLALIAGGHWRTFISASVSVLICVSISMLVIGTEPWIIYFNSAVNNLHGLENNIFSLVPMTTVLSSMVLAGGSLELARLLQYACMLSMLALITWGWWRGQPHPATQGLQNALVCIATPLALPVTFVYDLLLLTPAIAWIGLDLYHNQGKHWEWGVLTLSTIAILPIISLSSGYQLQIGPLILFSFLLLTLHRYRLSLRRCGSFAMEDTH